jgi:hypothetical protein
VNAELDPPSEVLPRGSDRNSWDDASCAWAEALVVPPDAVFLENVVPDTYIQ